MKSFCSQSCSRKDCVLSSRSSSTMVWARELHLPTRDQPTLEEVWVIGSKYSHQLPHQEKGDEGVVGHRSVETALSVPRSAQSIRTPLSSRAIGQLGDEQLGALPVPKSTISIAPCTTPVAPAATVDPATSIAGIGETGTTCAAVSPATSATVTPCRDVHRILKLWLQKERPAVVTPCSSNPLLDAVVGLWNE